MSGRCARSSTWPRTWVDLLSTGCNSRFTAARATSRGVNGDRDETIAFWHLLWQAEELPFLEHDRPWERADVVVAGTSPSTTGDGDIAVGRWQHGAT